VRPAHREFSTGELCEFIEVHRGVFGVAPICRALALAGLALAPGTLANSYYTRRRRGVSKRALWDTTITEVLAGFYEPDEQGRRRPESLYGAVKMWEHLNREGIPVAKCTVERLMRLNGWAGATRQCTPRTTTADPDAEDRRPADLVDRQFQVCAPDVLWVADFTYVQRVAGRWCYTAFTIDAFADLIVGWHTTTTADAAMVEASFGHGLEYRARQGHRLSKTIHHSDAGSQYTALHFAGQLAEAGFRPSIGSVGDAYDNALAETIIGLYKTECTPLGSPFNPNGFHTLLEIETGTADWVHWFNTRRLLHRLGRRPPAEAEAEHYAQHHADHPVGTN
jgi:transposase InsO family protein